MSAPEVELARWQRRYFQILEEFFRRAYESTIDGGEPSFGDGVRTNAIRFASIRKMMLDADTMFIPDPILP